MTDKVDMAARGSSKVAPLLKFRPSSQEPYVCEEGLNLLAAQPAPLSVVALLGDGRCGKSTLASRLINPDFQDPDSSVFAVGDTGQSVTEGVDICVTTGGASGSGSLAVLDCEGGNNPTATIRSAVDLVAMLASTLTVQVVWGQMSEGQLMQIGQILASRDRLLVDCKSTSKPRLLIVVNGCHLKYDNQHLTDTFEETHGESEKSRNELRRHIKNAYEKIDFCTVPLEVNKAYAEELQTFRQAVAENCQPLKLGGSLLSGAQVGEMVMKVVTELSNVGVVPIPSVFRHVIFDHMLMPHVERLSKEFEASLPDLSDNDYRSDLVDPRFEFSKAFSRLTEHLTHKDFVEEAHEHLQRRMEHSWNTVVQRNTAIGDQVRDVTTESDTRFSHTDARTVGYKRAYLVFGSHIPVVRPCPVYRIWTRTRSLKKNGLVTYTEWLPTGMTIDKGAEMEAGDFRCCRRDIIKSTFSTNTSSRFTNSTVG